MNGFSKRMDPLTTLVIKVDTAEILICSRWELITGEKLDEDSRIAVRALVADGVEPEHILSGLTAAFTRPQIAMERKLVYAAGAARNMQAQAHAALEEASAPTRWARFKAWLADAEPVYTRRRSAA